MAIKKSKKLVEAYELGKETSAELNLINAGKIIKLDANQYRLKSGESTDKGELATSGDFFKIDDDGNPYPNKRQWFLKNHRHIKANTYEQIITPVKIWKADSHLTEEIEWLIHNKLLKLNFIHRRLAYTALNFPTNFLKKFHHVAETRADFRLGLHALNQHCLVKILIIKIIEHAQRGGRSATVFGRLLKSRIVR